MDEKKNFDHIELNNFVLIGRASVDEIYADGISNILIGYPLMKFTFHSVVEAESENSKEVRKAVALITMDTPSALDVAFDILEACKTTEAAMLESANSSFPARLKAFLDKIPADMFSKITNQEAETITEEKKPVKTKAKKTH